MYGKRGKFNKFARNKKNPVKKVYRHHDQLSEVDVGITEYISNLDSFSGIIKARFSDFQVNEIDLNGQEAVLTDTSIPKDFISKQEKIDINTIEQSPIEQLPQKIWEDLKSLAESKEEGEPFELDGDSIIKEDRKRIHECIRNYFGQKIIANTINSNGKTVIRFKKYNQEGKDNRLRWPEDKPLFVHFMVYKEAIDTMYACMKIADCLRMSPSNFTYAGVKDKRAKTTQWFSVKKVAPWKLIVKTKFLNNIKIGNICFKETPLKLGQLLGNRFRIALRNVVGDDDLINKAMKNIKETGFINYYGLQRFGNDKSVPTFQVGLNLLLGNWKKAVELILKPKDSDDPEEDVSKAKKEYFDTEDVSKAVQFLEKSKNKCVEAKLLEGLQKNGNNNYVNALENIPRNMRLLYLHSFQSLIWNKLVSKRLQLYGMEPVEGDFVLVDENVKNDSTPSNDAEEQDDNEENNDKIVCKQTVRALKNEELENHTIYDIVLPLPGYDINYPENLVDYYKEAIEEYGLPLEMTKQKIKTYTLSGNYRKIVEKVDKFSWKIMKYDDPTSSLILSDYEKIKGHLEPQDVLDGKFKALILDFTLPSSSYATMVLREFLKMDTSSSVHSQLNNYDKSFIKTDEKKINLDGEKSDKKIQTITDSVPNSLLENQNKFEEFKNDIFKNTKRKNDDETQDENIKRIKQDNENNVATQ